jgi:serine/threonine protein phosphatase 1
MKERTLVIGDIHGANKALLQVLQLANFNPEIDKLICLGDYVDGWSESAEVIDTLIGIENKSKFCGNKNEPIFIRGNHDVWCENWLEVGFAKDIWTQQGGQATIDSYIRTGFLTEESHKKFFRNLHNYYIDEQNRGFVHGGFKSKKGLGNETYQADYYWDRDLFTIALCNDSSNAAISKLLKNTNRYNNHKEVYLGHTSTNNWNYKLNGVLRIKDTNNPDCKVGKPITTPIRACNVWNLDTGAGWGGKLTIMDIDTKEYYQSDYVSKLYPEEKGRN